MSEYDALIAELAAFRAFLTERGCGGVGDANGMHDLAQHHEELIADNERQAARIARLETALQRLWEQCDPSDTSDTVVQEVEAALADAPEEPPG